jgi:N-acetyltransferase
MIHPKRLDGHLIQLQELAPRHLYVLEKVGANPIIWQNLLFEGWRNDIFWSWASDALERQNAGKEVVFAIIENSTGHVVGTTRFQDMDAQHNKTDIGSTWYDPSVWGKGYNYEAKHLMFTHAFEVWKLGRVGFKVDERNVRSQRALEKVGASQEGYIRNHLIRPDGSNRNSFLYGLTDEDWFLSVKKMLQSRVVEKIIKQKSFFKNIENEDWVTT